MRGFQTEALVLRAVDFGESDRILHLLVPGSGRLTAIAKGARRSVRRFSGTLDLFHHLRIQVDRRRPNAMARLDQARLIESFDALRVDPHRFGLGCYLLELLDRLAPDGGSPTDMRRLFRFSLEALATIAASAPDARLRIFLELRALDALGVRPQLDVCVRCGRRPDGSGQAAFHVGDGGVVCGACAPKFDGLVHVHLGTLRALQQGLRFDFERLDRLVMDARALSEAQELVSRFQRFHIGVELRSERFLDRIQHEAPRPQA